ncbi:MAG TPA: hypothetical protein VMJ32_08635 [Pirellulales bacterium]|nr:hypothetical protein [Pirellulales bacterium]
MPQPQEFYLPSPDEIARATAALRQTWSEAEHHRRAGIEPRRVEIRQAPDAVLSTDPDPHDFKS